MAHTEQRQFFESVKKGFPNYFINTRVLDIGSLDINGTIRDLFFGAYIGVDVAPGKGVDVVSLGHEFQSEPFDVVLSAETLEHDCFRALTIENMKLLLKPKGLLIITAAGHTRPEHGTPKEDPACAPLLGKNPKMNPDFYENVNINEISMYITEKDFSNIMIHYIGQDINIYAIKR